MQAWVCRQASFTRQDQAGAVDGGKKNQWGKISRSQLWCHDPLFPFTAAESWCRLGRGTENSKISSYLHCVFSVLWLK